MSNSQPGILAPVPALSRYLEFRLLPDSNPKDTLSSLSGIDWDDGAVIGFGAGLLKAVGHGIDGIHAFPAMSGPGCDVPSTQADLWCWIRGEDRGDIVHHSRSFTQMVEPAFDCEHIVDGFRYGEGLDLSGYEDGTENPEGDAAIAAAIVEGQGAGLDGASFVSTQQWLHNLDYFESMAQDTRDNIIGRRLSDNEELDDAPESAHVKRTA